MVDTIFGAELLQILSLTAQLIQIVDFLIIDFFFRHNFSVLKLVIFVCAVSRRKIRRLLLEKWPNRFENITND